MRVLLYARRSHPDEDPGSIPIQLADCRERAEEEGWEVFEEYVDDGVSAWDPRKRRPEFERMLGELAPGTTILVREQERLIRQTKDVVRLQELAEAGKLRRIACTLEGDIDFRRARDRQDFRDRASQAQFYSDFLSEKIRSTLRRKKERGEWAGGGRRPFGYRVVGPKPFRLEPDPREGDLLREASRRVLTGESLHSTVLRWNDGTDPVEKDSGSRWTITDVRRVLLSEQVAGLRGGVEGAWEAILDRETHELLKVRLNDPSRRFRENDGRRARKWALAGLAKCGECGTTLQGKAQERPTGLKRSYTCSTSNGGCGGSSIHAPGLERHVIAWAYENVPEPAPTSTTVPIASEEEAATLRELRELEERKRGMGRDYAEGLLTGAQVAEATAALDAEIARLQGGLRLTEPRRPGRRFLATFEEWQDFIEGRTDSLLDDDAEELNLWLRDEVRAIRIAKARRPGIRFDASRVEVVWR